MVNIQSIKNYLERCYRILIILKKPTNEEFKQVSLITLVGFIIVGIIAMLIWILTKIIFS